MRYSSGNIQIVVLVVRVFRIHCNFLLKFSSTGRFVGQALLNNGGKISDLSQALGDLRAALTVGVSVGVSVQTAFVSAQTWEGVDKLGGSRKIPGGSSNPDHNDTISQSSQIFSRFSIPS